MAQAPALLALDALGVVLRGAALLVATCGLLTGTAAQATTSTRSARSRETCRSAAASCPVGAQPAPARCQCPRPRPSSRRATGRRRRATGQMCHGPEALLGHALMPEPGPPRCRYCKVHEDAPHHHCAAQLRTLHQEVCEVRPGVCLADECRGSPADGCSSGAALPRRQVLHTGCSRRRYEKRHGNIPAHVSPCFRVNEGDTVVIGQCRCGAGLLTT